MRRARRPRKPRLKPRDIPPRLASYDVKPSKGKRSKNTFTFDSWGAFLEEIDTAPNLTPEHNQQSRNESQNKFRGGTYKNIRKLASEGWPDGAKTAQELSAGMVDAIASTIERFDPYYSEESSGQLDVARYLDGEPECWIRLESITTEGPGLRHITIVFNGSASAGVSHETMITKGAAVAALAECLEYSGHRVKLILAFGFGHDSGAEAPIAEVYCTIKEFDQTLDIDRLTFSLAHPGTLRGLTFALMETWNDALRDRLSVGYTYSYPAETVERGDIYIGKSGAWEDHWGSPETAQTWIKAELENQGVKLNPNYGGN